MSLPSLRKGHNLQRWVVVSQFEILVAGISALFAPYWPHADLYH